MGERINLFSYSLNAGVINMAEQVYREEFKALVDRSMMILILSCDTCGEVVAKIVHPKTAKLDKTCDKTDHLRETGHSAYTALKHVIVYMNLADKELSEEVSEHQRKEFEKFFH